MNIHLITTQVKTSQVVLDVKNSPETQKMTVWSLGLKIPLEGMATHSSILGWRIPWWAIVHRVAKTWTPLKWISIHTHIQVKKHIQPASQRPILCSLPSLRWRLVRPMFLITSMWFCLFGSFKHKSHWMLGTFFGHCLINTPPPRLEFGGEMTCSRSHRVRNLNLLFLLADELFLSPVQWGPQSCLPRQCLVETSHPGLALPCGNLWAAAPPLHLAVLDHYVPRVLWGPREQMSPRSVTLAWRWSVGIVTPQTFLLLGCFHLFCYPGVGWGGGRGTEGKFPASKVPTLLFRTGWRKGTSVYRGSTLPDDALGALPAFIIPSPDNFTRQGLSIFIFPKIKLGLRGLTGPAHVT